MDNKKNVRFSGMGIYMIIVIIAAMFIMYVARMNTGTSNYTYNELVNDISKGKIESVSIRQNAEVPTGVVPLYQKYPVSSCHGSIRVSQSGGQSAYLSE